jgi:hypothetical protein
MERMRAESWRIRFIIIFMLYYLALGLVCGLGCNETGGTITMF